MEIAASALGGAAASAPGVDEVMRQGLLSFAWRHPLAEVGKAAADCQCKQDDAPTPPSPPATAENTHGTIPATPCRMPWEITSGIAAWISVPLSA